MGGDDINKRKQQHLDNSTQFSILTDFLRVALVRVEISWPVLMAWLELGISTSRRHTGVEVCYINSLLACLFDM